MFFCDLVCPYHHLNMTECLKNNFEKLSVSPQCPLKCTLNPTIGAMDCVNRPTVSWNYDINAVALYYHENPT